MRFFAPCLVRRPVLGQIELPVDQGMAKAAGIAGEDADLAVLDPTSRPRILAADTDGVATFLQKSRLIDHQDAVGAAKRLDHIVAHKIA